MPFVGPCYLPGRFASCIIYTPYLIDFINKNICHFRYGSKGLEARSGNVPVGTGLILLDNAHCSGSESTISDCNANKWGEHDCSHLQDAAVVCNHCKFRV